MSGRAAGDLETLSPAYFAFVMATGVVSIATFLLGPRCTRRVLHDPAALQGLNPPESANPPTTWATHWPVFLAY